MDDIYYLQPTPDNSLSHIIIKIVYNIVSMNTENLEHIGKQLKIARENLKLTQVEVADKVGLHPNFYARVERGEEPISMDTLEKLVKVLKVKSSDILPF